MNPRLRCVYHIATLCLFFICSTHIAKANVTPTFINTSPQNLSVCSGATLSLNTFLHVSDADGSQTETWSQLAAPNHGGTIAITGATANSGSTNITPGGTISYTPQSGYTGIDTFTIQVSDGTATSSMDIYVTVNPIPAVTISALTQSGCNSALTTAINFTSSVPGTTYAWTNNNTSVGLGASGSGAAINAFTAANSGAALATATITVIPTANSCSGLSRTATITVNPTPLGAVSLSAQTLCNGVATTAIAFSSSVTGTTFSWTNSAPTIGLAAAGTGNIASFTAVNTGNAAITATIAATPVANGCFGSPRTATITIKPTPSVSISVSAQSLCTGTTTAAINFSSSVAGTTYTWTNNNSSIGLTGPGSGNIAAFTATNTGTTPAIAGIGVTPVANSCQGGTQSAIITVNPNPTITLTNTFASAVASMPAAFVYSAVTGAPDRYSAVWASNPIPAVASTAFGSSPIYVPISATATPGGPYNGTLTIANSTTTCSRNYSITTTVIPIPDTFYTAATGNLTSTGTWGKNADGTGAHPSSITASNRIFRVTNGNSGVLSTALTLGTNSIFEFDNLKTTLSGGKLTGAIKVSANDTLIIASDPSGIVINSDNPVNSNIVFKNDNDVSVPISDYYGNVQVGTGGSGTITLAGISVHGILKVNCQVNLSYGEIFLYDTLVLMSGGIDASLSTVYFLGSTPITIPAGFFQNDSVYYLSSSNTAGVSLAGDFVIRYTLTNSSGPFIVGPHRLKFQNYTGVGTLSVTSSSNIACGGSANSQNLYFTSGANTIDSLTITTETYLASPLNIASTGTLFIGSCVFGASTNLTLLSDANGTGRIATLGVGGAIGGTVTVQRYIPGQRGYRLMGHPFTTARNLSTFENYIDVNAIGGNATCYNPAPSAFRYTPGANPVYTGITSGTGTFPEIESGNSWANGILVFVRGAKGEGCYQGSPYIPSAITYSESGTIHSNTVTEKVPAHGWNLIANPYPSQISLANVSGISGLSLKIVTPGAQAPNTYTNGTAYVTLSPTAIVPIYGAFLAYNSSSSDVTLTFTEASKTADPPTANSFKTTSVYPTLGLSVYYDGKMWDDWDMQLRPNTGANAGDDGDLEKLSNAQLDIYSLSADGQHMNRDARAEDSIADGTVIQLGLRSVPQAAYTLTVNEQSLPANKIAYLHDKYMNTYVVLTNGLSYQFTVDSNAASQGEGRLELLFNNVANSTGVGNVAGTQQIQISPNPATTNIRLSYPVAFNGNKEISIINAVGQVVRTLNSNDRIVNVDVAGLAAGVYMIKTAANGNTAIGKFFKN